MPGRSILGSVPLLLAAVLLFPAVPLAAQDSVGAAQGGASPVAATEDLVTSTLALDIGTASLYELAAWATSLGLPSTGGLEELRGRLYAHFGVKPPGIQASGRRITIERAAAAEYFNLEYLSEPLVRISGGVVLTVKEEGNDETERLEADEVIYDKSRDAVTARGRVKFRRESASGVDEFSGETLSVRLGDGSGVFLDGVMRRSGASTGQAAQAAASASTTTSTSTSTTSSAATTSEVRTFSFEADTMLRRSGDVIVLEKGVVSSCSAEDPHYSVRAKRLWLLGPNEWAVADAVISIGEVPVLWLPFFFYPGEEIVFHPVLGYAEREGRFTQTTTYLVGAKPAAKDSSILSFGQSDSGQAKEVKGLFFVPVKGKKAEKDDGSSLKVLGDIYSSLGAYLGLVGVFPKAGPLKTLKFDLGLGLTRSLFATSSGYSPFVAAGSWESQWNSINLLGGLSLPFRFGLDASTTIALGPLTATLSLPLYSDAYYKDDFRDNRSEDMDWLGLSSSTTSTTTTTISSFTQSLGVSGSLKTGILAPYLSGLQVNRLNASLAWLSKRNAALYTDEGSTLFSVDPARYFFYPNLLRPLDVSLTLKGGLPTSGTSAAATTSHPASAGPAGPESKDLRLATPWDGGELPDEATTAAGSRPRGTEKADEAQATAAGGEFSPPARLPSMKVPTATPGGLALDWSLTPSFYVEDRFLSDAWTGPSDIAFGDVLYSLASWSLVGSLDASYHLPGDLASATLSFDGTTQDQSRTTTSDSAYASLVKTYLLTDYKYRLSKLSSGILLKAKPFAEFYPLSASTLSYNLEGYLYRNIYSSLDGDGNPVYTTYTPGWDTDTVTANTASASLALKTGGATQSLGLAMSLPPLTESYSGTLNLAAPPGTWTATLVLGSRLYRTSSAASFSWDPLSATLNAKTPFGLALTDTLSYDLDNARPKTNSASLSWGPLTSTLAATWSQVYTPVAGSGWVASGAQSFLLSSVSTVFNRTWKTPASSPLDLNLTVRLAYDQSLLRFSESTLGLKVDLTAKLGTALDLTVSTTSQNSSAWRYCPWLFPAAYNLGDPETYFRNPLTDIAYSFAFGDDSLRKASLFKLKSASVKLSHDLHDWTVSFSLTSTPTLDTTAKSYYLETDFTLLLAWKDMPQIKSSLTKSSSGFSF